MSCFTDFLQSDITASAALQQALKAAIDGDRTLLFPAGEYHFYPEGCPQRYCYFSNNDEGVKTIAMLLDGVDDFTIRGNGTLLIFHGRISPLYAFNCRNLTVEGIEVDFADSFVSDADMVERKDGVAWFKFFGQHKVVNGKLIFTDDFYDNMSGLLPFTGYDRERQEVMHRSPKVTVPNREILYKDGLVGVKDLFADAKTDAFVVKHEVRLCPGMVFDQCTDIVVKKVSLYHAAGMGFLVQNSENCRIESAVVAPRNRRTAVSDDALHIADCRGKLQIIDCKLSGTLDDSINVHGVYRKLKSRIPGGKMFYLEAGHYQQQGVFNVRPGDHIELRKRENGVPYGVIEVKNVRPVNKSFVIVDIDEREIPAEFTEGDPAWILETQAELEVRGTECRPLGGRGVLASGLKKVHISGCKFHSSGAGVFVSGDFSYWYESGPVAEMVIEENFFDNCNYNPNAATREPLAVFPELRSLQDGFWYHGNIVVRNNHFRSWEQTLVSMMSVRKAEVVGNTFEQDDRYLREFRTKAGYFFTDKDSPTAAFLHCKEVTLENNAGFRD